MTPDPALLLRAVPDGLWLLDADGRTLFANDPLLALLGRSADEMHGFSAYDALDESGAAVLRERLAERVDPTVPPAPGTRGDRECRLYRPDGTAVWVLVSPEPVVDDDGRLVGWMHRIKDNAEQHDLLELSQRREHQFAEAQAIAHIGSWDMDLVTGELVWSDETFRLVGRVPGSLVPTPEEFFGRVHPDDRENGEAAFEALVAGAPVMDFEARLVNDDAKPRWVRAQGRAVLDDAGVAVRVDGTLQDITAAKENEQALEFLSVMAAAANEASSLQEALIASEKYVRPYSKWPAVLVAVPDPEVSERLLFLDVAWGEEAEGLAAAAREVAITAAQERRTVHQFGPSGSALVAGPVLFDDRIAAVVVSDSLVPFEPPPSDLIVFNQMLTFLAHVAEREWAAQDLAAARDQALSASRAKSEFLATMSHEIRTPLNGVLGLSELLARTELTPHQRRLADGVEHAGRTLLALVNDILDLSKIEAGRLDLEAVDFDPRAVVEQSAALVADLARDKHLELVVSSAGDMPAQVRGDPVRFGQVITNLASNAVKFTADGEVVIRATGETGPDGPRVRVEVRDTGVGIDPEAASRLFEPFTQADSSTTREYGGTGLGLAISRRIVSAMGGQIGVDSDAGVGSTFWFTVGFEPPVGDDPLRDHEREQAVRGLQVLVVDDNETNRFILVEQLSAWGVTVTAVESAPAGLVEISSAARGSSPYDVVLLDYMMPGTDGEELARALRSERVHDRTRLVLLSSALEPTPEWLADAGIDTFLSKPVLPTRLLDVLARQGGRLGRQDHRPVETPRAVPTRRRGRVLVVEDNEVNQLVAEGVLHGLGYEVHLADNGAAGVAAVADDYRGFDAILMDCQMPVMDGYDATRAIRAMQRGGTRTPIIAMTAAAVAEERERCLAAGMDDFLAKPVDVALLDKTLARWAPSSSGHEEAEAAAAPEEPAVSPAFVRLRELIERDGIDPSLVVRIIERFESGALTVSATLGASVRAGDAGDVAAQAHSLKGSAANLGLTALAAVCNEIEGEARSGRLPADGILASLDAEIRAAGAELEHFAETRLNT
jgi:PAS domain S-box-containing protein